MPSAQVLNFGPDPTSESIGDFARSFSGSFFKQQEQKKNEDIFKRIQNRYGKDADPQDIFRDVLEAEGLDQDYKRDILKEIKDYATLANKSNLSPYQKEILDIKREDLLRKKDKDNQNPEKQITPYQQKLIEQRNATLALQKKRIEQSAKDKDAKFPKLISDYTSDLLKDSGESFSAHDKSILNSRVRSNIEDDKMPIDDAFQEALEYVQIKNQLVQESKIQEKPSHWYGSASQSEIEQAMDQAYQQLNQLFDSGLESQKDLREVAKRAGWKSEEINAMLQKIFQRNGKKFKSKSPQKSAEIPFQEQGVASQIGGLDDILFGD